MSSTAHQPIRMCVACRTRRPQSELLRLRRRPDGVVDVAERAPKCGEHAPPGTRRTAYLCPSRGCYDLAIKKRALSRALATNKGLSVRIESTTLWPSILNGLDKTIRRLERSGATPHRGRLHSTIRLRAELGGRGKDA